MKQFLILVVFPLGLRLREKQRLQNQSGCPTHSQPRPQPSRRKVNRPSTRCFNSRVAFQAVPVMRRRAATGRDIGYAFRR